MGSWKDWLHYGAGALLVLVGVMGEFVQLPAGMNAHEMIVAGAGILGVGAKIDAATIRAIAIPFLAAASVGASCLIGAFPAYAVDLTKAPHSIAPATCTQTDCVGLFVGGSIANAGGNLDVIGTGLQGVASNGQSIGTQFGGEYFRNSIYAAALVHVNYDMAFNSSGAGINDRISYGVCGRLGYSLASFFGATATGSGGISTPTIPQALASSLMTPYVNMCEDKRHGEPALGTGAGIEALLSSQWTANFDYLHYTYNQGGNAGSAIPLPVKQQDENAFLFSFNYHIR